MIPPTPMQYRKLNNWKYQLTSDYTVFTGIRPPSEIKTSYAYLTPGGRLTIYKNYAWDGATGSIDTKNFIRSSLVHDALCQMINENYLFRHNRKPADKLLRKMCKEDGMSPLRAWWVYVNVRIYVKLKYLFT